ncbi:hypothetical protein L0128_16035 [candidate division KSB1 bacterium]|nr:hypothetical protein [candidate division KSB1 bacterium]
MYTLHGIWDSTAAGKLYVWGESAVPGNSVKSTRTKGRKPKKTTDGRHPFALAPAELETAIAPVTERTLIEKLARETVTLLLPTANEQPLASPDLIRETDAEPIPAAGLKPWQVPVVVLEAGLALDFLLALPLQPTAGMVVGNSLRYWTEVTKLVLELIIQQRYFPSLQPIQPPTYRATWAVYLSENDFDRLDAFSKAMPPVCRSLVLANAAATVAPLPQILAFLNQVCDAYLRESLRLQKKLPLAGDPRKKNLSLVESWLHALTTDTGTFDVIDETELQKLVAWLEPIRPTATVAPFRTCFRVETPADDAPAPDLWTITYHLQATDDKSLMVSADKIWSRATSDLTFLKRKFENPQERLLADLARAERVFPALEKSLRTAQPARLNLNVTEAYQFLRETAPLLEQGGFGVLLPPWWQKSNARPGVKMTVRPATTSSGESLMGMSALINYNFSLVTKLHGIFWLPNSSLFWLPNSSLVTG